MRRASPWLFCFPFWRSFLFFPLNLLPDLIFKPTHDITSLEIHSYWFSICWFSICFTFASTYFIVCHFFSANTIHQPLCRNFHDKIKKFTGRYAPFAIRSKNGRLSIAPPTDVLVHVSTTRGVHYFLITYEFGDEDICLWRADGWRTRLPIRLVTAERDLQDKINSCQSPQSGTCKTKLIHVNRDSLLLFGFVGFAQCIGPPLRSWIQIR